MRAVQGQALDGGGVRGGVGEGEEGVGREKGEE